MVEIDLRSVGGDARHVRAYVVVVVLSHGEFDGYYGHIKTKWCDAAPVERVSSCRIHGGTIGVVVGGALAPYRGLLGWLLRAFFV